MTDSAIREQAHRLIAEAQQASLGGTAALKGHPAIAAAILDLADAVRELARRQ